MKIIIFLCLVAMSKAYTDLDDNVNVESLLDNPEEYKTTMGCYLDKNPCTDKALAFKNHMPETMDDGCRECNDKEKHLFKIFLKGVKDHFPDDYKLYQEKYDPTGVHFPILLAALENF